MREVILSYWNSVFTDLIRPYRDDITAISALIVAIFAVVLARVAWKQSRDARILQRAYLDVRFGGVRNIPTGELVGRVDFKNVGHLPAQKLRWLVRLDSGGIRGESIPRGAEWPRVSNAIPDPGEQGVCICMCGGVRLMRTDLDGVRGELISATAIRGK
jgi:hypothetical protein